jgi:NADPH-dependent glutamate synthase beta subunit-like oxidoreductase
MPKYDGNQFAQEGLLQVAQHSAQAALHAPQLTGKTEIKMEILTGKDLEDFFSVQAEANKRGAVLSGESYKLAYDLGKPPVLLLIGADATPDVKAPCRAACPVGIDVPRYIRLIGDGKYDQAAAVVREKVPLASICARICHAPCEAKCRRGTLRDQPIAILALKRFAMDAALDGKPSLSAGKTTGKRIAVIGSGPAGLTAAYYLRKLCGHSVTVFEASSKPGGMLRSGVPEYRLPREVLDKEIDRIKELGVEIKLETKIDSLDKLFQQGYEAIFVAIGAHRPTRLDIKGEDLPGVMDGLSFLRDVNLGKKPKVGKRVAVVGGGNAAVDASRAALRLGAKEVAILYRRSMAEMLAHRNNVEQAKREGVKIEFLVSPTLIQKGDGLEVKCARMKLGLRDSTGRPSPEPIPGSEFNIMVDTVIVAAGQLPDVPHGFGLSLGNGGTFQVDEITLSTNKGGVFAGGDAVSGPASFIEAVAAGRKAASWIDQYLGGLGIIDEILAPPEEMPKASRSQELRAIAGSDPQRASMPVLAAEQALAGFGEVELGLSEKAALIDTTRCLKCNEVGFNCGACGFKTCREAVIFSQNRLHETEGEPWGWLMKGPTCIWRLTEYGIAVDWAAAAVHRHNIESRVAMIPGTAFMRMGHLPDCNMIVVVPIGPCKERWYFEPSSGREDFRPFAIARRAQMLQYSPLWLRFTGPGRDFPRRGMKTKDEWWKGPYERLDIVKDEEWGNAILDRDYAIFEAADKIRQKNKLKRLNLPKIKEILDAKKTKT